MNVEEVTEIVLTLPGASRSRQSQGPDFRVGGKIFATLPSATTLVLKLTAGQQAMVLRSDPAVFAPVEGGWGARGWTNADLAGLDEAAALAALIMAWSNAAPEKPASAPDGPRTIRHAD